MSTCTTHHLSGPCACDSPRAKVLTFIANFLGQNGYPPTVRQIGAGVGISSTATVHDLLRQLQRRGELVVTSVPGHTKRMEVRA